MKCKQCGHIAQVIDSKDSRFIDRDLSIFPVFYCENCSRHFFITDKNVVELHRFRQKLLDESNHSHNAFVFRLVREYRKISTICLLQHCAAAYISNGDREARTLKTKGLLGNYKPPGKKYVVWFEKSLVA